MSMFLSHLDRNALGLAILLITTSIASGQDAASYETVSAGRVENDRQPQPANAWV